MTQCSSLPITATAETQAGDRPNGGLMRSETMARSHTATQHQSPAHPAPLQPSLKQSIKDMFHRLSLKTNRRNCGKDMLRFIVKNQLSVNMFYHLYMVQLHLYMLLQQLKLCSALELIQIQFTTQFQDVQELLNSSSPYSNHKAF